MTGQAFIAAGFDFVDAPVSGGVRRAVDGTLAIMVGGDPTSIDRVLPVLNAMGRSIFRTGKLGSGHAMKALNNYVSAAGLVAAVEIRVARGEAGTVEIERGRHGQLDQLNRFPFRRGCPLEALLVLREGPIVGVFRVGFRA